MISKEYLDEERKKLWEEVLLIKQQLNIISETLEKKTSDYESEAKQASRKASEYRNKAQASKETADQTLQEILSIKDRLDFLISESLDKNSQLIEIEQQASQATLKISEFENKAESFDKLFLSHEGYKSITEEMKIMHTEANEKSSKINGIYNLLSKRKSEIDEIYYEIFGYEHEDEETGETKSIEGTKDELSSAYLEIKSDLSGTKIELSELKEETERQHDEQLKKTSKIIEAKLEEWENNHNAATQKIKDLLPDALTAGLSHAFSEKKSAEIASGEKLNKVFNFSIFFLVLISLIPFGINGYLLHLGKTLEQVIYDMPKLLAAITPVYIPLIWLAYSSSKKSNLSKRLVEEYTHKEVLSKTFEGLSGQIESLNRDDISSELHIKLLSNLLDVSAENPGKLISNYDTSDHPLIDALEKSSKLSEAISKLENIPGMQRISKILERKSKRNLNEESNKINDGLDAVATND